MAAPHRALYKYNQWVQQTTSDAFDKVYKPETATPFSGIYRCQVCGWNDVSTHGHPLPPQNHHQHPGNEPILWRLLVSTQ